jgi:5-methylcytosine-specific restriction enzyme A
MNYWIFQGNPNKFDVNGYLQNYEYVYWGLRQNQNKVKLDDVVFFRMAKGNTNNPNGIMVATAWILPNK